MAAFLYLETIRGRPLACSAGSPIVSSRSTILLDILGVLNMAGGIFKKCHLDAIFITECLWERFERDTDTYCWTPAIKGYCKDLTRNLLLRENAWPCLFVVQEMCKKDHNQYMKEMPVEQAFLAFLGVDLFLHEMLANWLCTERDIILPDPACLPWKRNWLGYKDQIGPQGSSRGLQALSISMIMMGVSVPLYTRRCAFYNTRERVVCQNTTVRGWMGL